MSEGILKMIYYSYVRSVESGGKLLPHSVLRGGGSASGGSFMLQEREMGHSFRDVEC